MLAIVRWVTSRSCSRKPPSPALALPKVVVLSLEKPLEKAEPLALPGEQNPWLEVGLGDVLGRGVPSLGADGHLPLLSSSPRTAQTRSQHPADPHGEGAKPLPGSGVGGRVPFLSWCFPCGAGLALAALLWFFCV